MDAAVGVHDCGADWNAQLCQLWLRTFYVDLRAHMRAFTWCIRICAILRSLRVSAILRRAYVWDV